MGGPESIDALAVLTKRLDVLQRLCEGPAHKRDLEDELDLSRSTIDRAIRELEELSFVRKCDGGVTASAAGRNAVDHLDDFQSGLTDIVQANTVVEPLPSDSSLSVDVLTGSDSIETTEPLPYRALEPFHEEVAGADRYRVMLPNIDDPRHVRLLYEHVVTDGQPADLLVTPTVFETLQGEFSLRLADMAAEDGFHLRVTEEVPDYGLGLLESDGVTTVVVVVFQDNGAVHGTLRNETPSAVRWGETHFEETWRQAPERTDSCLTDPEGEAVTENSGATRASARTALPRSLAGEGFVRLDAPYFREAAVADPTTAWRSGLSLAEVHTGYAIDRRDADGTGEVGTGEVDTDEDGSKANGDGGVSATGLTDELLGQLVAGTDSLLLGSAGTGKSTICKRVACRWYEADRGTVFYREQGRGRRFESVDELVESVDAADGHVLVVVEDAVRRDANAVFRAIDSLADREDVSFIMDARDSEWTDPPDRVDTVEDLAVVRMPTLNHRDCDRLIEIFERTTGEVAGIQAGDLLETVRREATGEMVPGDLLLALHRLITAADPLGDGPTPLESAVRDVYDSLADDYVMVTVGILANTLNAAGHPVHPAALYSVANPEEKEDKDEGEEDGSVEAALQHLEGTVLFPQPGSRYRTVHESWSVAFLAACLDALGEAEARRRFGDAMTALLSAGTVGEPRDGARTEAGASPVAPGFGGHSAEWVEQVLEAVYSLGRDWPKLSALFGTSAKPVIDLPTPCSPESEARRVRLRGEAYVRAGEYDAAGEEFEYLLDLADRLETGEHEVEALRGLGTIAYYRSEYERARECHEEGIALARDLDYPGLEADHRKGLGGVHWLKGEYDRAGEQFDLALAIAREIGDRTLESELIGTHGLNAMQQAEYDRARDYFDRALEIQRELGLRSSQAKTLSNLGIVARRRCNFDQAVEFQEQSLALVREMGERQAAANTLNNLGRIEQNRGAFREALEYYRDSLAIKRELGDRHGEAGTLNNLGFVSFKRSAVGDAREYHERALDIATDIDSPLEEAHSHRGLAAVARSQGRYDRAEEHVDRAIEILAGAGKDSSVAETKLEAGTVALDRGDVEEARHRVSEARSTFHETDADLLHSRCRRLLGRIERADGDSDSARRHWRDALNTFEELEAFDDALRTVECLVELALDEEGEKAAVMDELGNRATTLANRAPESAVANHREWLYRIDCAPDQL